MSLYTCNNILPFKGFVYSKYFKVDTLTRYSRQSQSSQTNTLITNPCKMCIIKIQLSVWSNKCDCWANQQINFNVHSNYQVQDFSAKSLPSNKSVKQMNGLS